MSGAASSIDREALQDLGRHLIESGYRFVTPTPATHARVNARAENRLALDARGVFGWSRPFHPSAGFDQLLGQMRRAGIAVRDGELWRSTLRASTLDGQLYFHSAFPTVEADAVFFGPDSYRFARALLATPPRENVRRIVEIGCGAGPGAIPLALRYPEAEVLGTDINQAALTLTGVNATLAGVRNLATRRSDVLRDVGGRFDLIVCNPPYLIDAQQRTYRDGGGALGAGLSLRILEEAAERLAPGAMLQLYTGSAIVDGRDGFRDAAAALMARAGLAWSYEEIDPDVFGEELDCPAYAGSERIAAVLLTARRH